jgi:hypothetical protein
MSTPRPYLFVPWLSPYGTKAQRNLFFPHDVIIIWFVVRFKGTPLRRYPAGTVTIGTPAFSPVSVSVKINMRKENTFLDRTSLSSIQNQ